MNINSASITKLHEKVIWFYRHLSEEYDVPIIYKFINETIPAAFKTMKDRQGLPTELALIKQYSSESLGKQVPGSIVRHQISGSKMPHTGVVRLYLSMFNERNV